MFARASLLLLLLTTSYLVDGFGLSDLPEAEQETLLLGRGDNVRTGNGTDSTNDCMMDAAIFGETVKTCVECMGRAIDQSSPVLRSNLASSCDEFNALLCDVVITNCPKECVVDDNMCGRRVQELASMAHCTAFNNISNDKCVFACGGGAEIGSVLPSSTPKDDVAFSVDSAASYTSFAGATVTQLLAPVMMSWLFFGGLLPM